MLRMKMYKSDREKIIFCWEMKGLLEEEDKYGYYLGMFVDHQIKI